LSFEFTLTEVQDDKVYQCSDWVVEALSGDSGETQVNARLSKAVDSDHTSEESDTDSD
jgi:20S proteasome alpha/beta subunit